MLRAYLDLSIEIDNFFLLSKNSFNEKFIFSTCKHSAFHAHHCRARNMKQAADKFIFCRKFCTSKCFSFPYFQKIDLFKVVRAKVDLTH